MWSKLIKVTKIYNRILCDTLEHHEFTHKAKLTEEELDSSNNITLALVTIDHFFLQTCFLHLITKQTSTSSFLTLPKPTPPLPP